MINSESFFDEISANMALWFDGGQEAGDLAHAASVAATHAMPVISALPSDVPMLWTWLEKTSARIYARFYLPPRGARDMAVMSDLTVRINNAFKHGAHGAQIFMRAADLVEFANEIGTVRDDLFFNRELAIGIDISDVDALGWDDVFSAVRRLRAGALILVMARDTGNKSDFVGRVYAAANAATNIKCDLHFVLGANPVRIEQAARIVRAIRPEMAAGVRFFVNAVG